MSRNWKNEPISGKQKAHLVKLGYTAIEDMNKMEYDIVMREHYTQEKPTDKQKETVVKIVNGANEEIKGEIKLYFEKWGQNHHTCGVVISKYGVKTSKARINAIMGR